MEEKMIGGKYDRKKMIGGQDDRKKMEQGESIPSFLSGQQPIKSVLK